MRKHSRSLPTIRSLTENSHGINMKECDALRDRLDDRFKKDDPDPA